MLKKINYRLANNILLITFCGTLIFHLSIIIGFTPFDLVWGGRLETYSQMLVFESFSILITLWVIYLVLINLQRVKSFFSKKFISKNFWFLAVLFGLNTVGNLISLSSLETIIFTPITLILFILCLRLTSNQEDR